MNYYMHIFRGRIRIRSSALIENQSQIQAMDRFLRSIPGITLVDACDAMGNLLISYNPLQISSKAIFLQLAKEDYLPKMGTGHQGLFTQTPRPLSAPATSALSSSKLGAHFSFAISKGVL